MAATDPIDAVLFDLDGTLVEYERPPGEVLERAFERAGVEPFFPVEAYYERFEASLEAAGPEEDFRAACFADIAAERGRDPDVGRRVAEAYAAIRDPGKVRRLPGALDVLEGFARRYAVGLVTNGPPAYQDPKLEATGLADRFGTVVYAGRDAAAKPDPEPFERALAALGVPPERAVMIGNSLSADVAGAHAAGLRSVWVGADTDSDSDPDSDPAPTPDYAVPALTALRPPPWRD